MYYCLYLRAGLFRQPRRVEIVASHQRETVATGRKYLDFMEGDRLVARFRASDVKSWQGAGG